MGILCGNDRSLYVFLVGCSQATSNALAYFSKTSPRKGLIYVRFFALNGMEARKKFTLNLAMITSLILPVSVYSD